MTEDPKPPRSLHAVADSVIKEKDPTYGAVWDARPVLWPGTCYLDGVLYMTFPLPRNEEKIVGKGKAAHTVIEQNMRTICITSEGEAFWYDKETVMERGFTFPQTFTQELETRWQLADIQTFLAGEAPNINPAEIWTELYDLVFAHVEYSDDIWYDVLAYYIMISYVFRVFDSIGYLHFNGTMASGKSQNLRLLSLMSFNAVWASNMSAASLYRQIAGSPGMICLDEAESWDTERGEEIRRLLNAGYTHPGYVTRSEKEGDRFVVNKYTTYSPKALASINPLEPVIANRCLIVPMQPALRTIDSLSMSDPKWNRVRTKLYLWAMQNCATLAGITERWQLETKLNIQSDLRDRHWEIALSYVVLADHVGGLKEAQRMIKFFEKVFEQQRKAYEDVDRQRQLLRLLPRVFATKTTIDGVHWRVKDIHDVVSEYLDEDAREYYKTRQTGKHLNTLGWKIRKPAKGGTMVPITEQEVRDQFTKRHVDPYPEDADWMNGESYVEKSLAMKPDDHDGFNWHEGDGGAVRELKD